MLTVTQQIEILFIISDMLTYPLSVQEFMLAINILCFQKTSKQETRQNLFNLSCSRPCYSILFVSHTDTITLQAELPYPPPPPPPPPPPLLASQGREQEVLLAQQYAMYFLSRFQLFRILLEFFSQIVEYKKNRREKARISLVFSQIAVSVRRNMLEYAFKRALPSLFTLFFFLSKKQTMLGCFRTTNSKLCPLEFKPCLQINSANVFIYLRFFC